MYKNIVIATLEEYLSVLVILTREIFLKDIRFSPQLEGFF